MAHLSNWFNIYLLNDGDFPYAKLPEGRPSASIIPFKETIWTLDSIPIPWCFNQHHGLGMGQNYGWPQNMYVCIYIYILISIYIYINPIGSMYGIYANIGGILMVNVTIYSIHGSYGICIYIYIINDHYRSNNSKHVRKKRWNVWFFIVHKFWLQGA